MSLGRRVLVVGSLLLLAAACTNPSAGRPPRPPATVLVPPSQAPTPTPATAARTLRVVGLGDSVMAGTNCGCRGLAQEYGASLSARVGAPVQVTNLGVGGKVTDDLEEDLAGDSATRSSIAGADVVLVTIGANDLLPELEQWRTSGCSDACVTSAAQRMGRKLAGVLAAVDTVRQGHRGTVLVTDYWNVFTDGDVARTAGGQAQLDWSTDVTAAANRQICAAARASGDTCVDLVGVFEPGGTDPTRLLADDGDHPNAAGVRAIVQALLAATPAAP